MAISSTRRSRSHKDLMGLKNRWRLKNDLAAPDYRPQRNDKESIRASVLEVAISPWWRLKNDLASPGATFCKEMTRNQFVQPCGSD